MGYWYWRSLKEDWVINENTTNKEDLPDKGHVSAIMLKLKSKNEADLSSYDNPYPVHRTDLTIRGNGNYPIISAKGRQLHAINFWNRGEMPKEGLDTIDTAEMEQYIYLMFGRYLGDPKYGLILDRFKSGVEFEDNNNIDTTYYTDLYTKYSLYALMRKNPEAELFSGGFLRKRLIKTLDAATRTKETVKLPTENKIRQIHLFSEPDQTSGVLAATVFNVINKLFLSIKTEEEYILDNIPSDTFARFIHDFFARRARTQVRVQTASGGGYYDTMIYEKRNSQLQHLQASAYMAVGDATTDLTRMQRVYSYLHDGSAASGRYVLLDTNGICLHGNIPLLLLDPRSDEEEWLDTKENAEVRVHVTENSSSGNWYVVLDELQKEYPV